MGDNENIGNNKRLLAKAKDFCSEVQFQVLTSLLADFWLFANFGSGLWVLEAPKAP